MELDTSCRTYLTVKPALSDTVEIRATAIEEPVCECVIEVQHVAKLELIEERSDITDCESLLPIANIDWTLQRSGYIFCAMPMVLMRIYLKDRTTTSRALELTELVRRYKNAATNTVYKYYDTDAGNILWKLTPSATNADVSTPEVKNRFMHLPIWDPVER